MIEEFPTFYACRPDWLTAEQQEQFKVNHPELVAEYADCWQDAANQPQETAA
jgi:hypothetical protein